MTKIGLSHFEHKLINNFFNEIFIIKNKFFLSGLKSYDWVNIAFDVWFFKIFK